MRLGSGHSRVDRNLAGRDIQHQTHPRTGRKLRNQRNAVIRRSRETQCGMQAVERKVIKNITGGTRLKRGSQTHVAEPHRGNTLKHFWPAVEPADHERMEVINVIITMATTF
jgi:hypothetical protein